MWPSGLTAWEPDAREVVLESFEGDVRVADGDTITVGGSGDIAGDWVAAPAASCPERRFLSLRAPPGVVGERRGQAHRR